MKDVPYIIFGLGRVSPDGVTPLGTAFVLPEENLIATAAHSIQSSDENLVVVLPRIKDLDHYQNMSDTSIRSVPASIVQIDPFRDIAILSAKTGIRSQITVTGADHIDVNDIVHSYGYPHADAGRLIVTAQEALVGAKFKTVENGVETKQLVLNLQARLGQSGSPVFKKETKDLVAILTGAFRPKGGGGIRLGNIDPYTLHQTTHAVSAEYLEAML